MAKSTKEKIARVLMVAVFLLAVYFSYRPGWVVKNYSVCADVTSSKKLIYEYIVNRYGEPVETDVEWKAKQHDGQTLYVIYTVHSHPEHGKLMFRYSTYSTGDPFADPGKWELCTITTYNPEHRFGWRRIHVGSTKDEVKRAYKHATPVKGVPSGHGYFEGDWLDWLEVHFTYDENDIVTSIQFIAGM